MSLNPLNNSSAKQQFSFSKSQRFPKVKIQNNHVAYSNPSFFDLKKDGGIGRPFYHTSTRFDYYRSPKKETKAPQPAPTHYNLGTAFGNDSNTPQKQYTFGVSRKNMKKIHIDDIKIKGVTTPGPGKYTHKETLGEGVFYSMASRLPTEKQMLEKSAKLPGPGQYVASDICGKELVNSSYKTSNKFSFGKAADRFHAPTKKVAAPSPDKYTPLNNFNENYNSTFVKSGQTVIGNNKSSILDQHFNLKNVTPGPGSYNRYSDFEGK